MKDRQEIEGFFYVKLYLYTVSHFTQKHTLEREIQNRPLTYTFL